MSKLIKMTLVRTVVQTAEVIVSAPEDTNETVLTREAYIEYTGDWRSESPAEGQHVTSVIRPDFIAKLDQLEPVAGGTVSYTLYKPNP